MLNNCGQSGVWTRVNTTTHHIPTESSVLLAFAELDRLERARAGFVADKHAARAKLTLQADQIDELRARIEANPKDHVARFDLAAILAHGGDFASAFEQLLEIVLRDKAEHREAARVRMVEWFGLCPDPAVTDRAQRRLAMYLN